jgi:hypothetical protein
MRFMVIVKANEESEAGGIPDEKLLADMGKYNEEMGRAFCSPLRVCTRARRELA